MPQVYLASSTAPVNIAVVKYWGKRDPVLNLPTNSSLSVTLSQEDLRAFTSVACSQDFPEDRMWLNGEERHVPADKRLVACLKALRALRQQVEDKDTSAPTLSRMCIQIASENNFPTAAGLASSAAGFAALVRAIADLYQLPQSAAELSRIARQGSGSACRSLFGGYVAWQMGSQDDGSDSMAVQVAPQEAWPQMRACILVASAQKKDVSSTAGMQHTVATSTLFAERVRQTVPDRMQAMTSAIEARDFAKFAEITMRDSNSFHAVCLDTYPPIFYMNDISRACVRLVEQMNAAAGATIAAYTYDAGPNTVVYYLEENEAKVLAYVKAAVSQGTQGMDSPQFSEVTPASDVQEAAHDVIEKGVQRVILTKVGPGAQSVSESLLDAFGFPTSEPIL
ncbi:diphosphomevalonate decarboxylase [Protomyces lactucae-debilis]|uniref:Diphosphomevalonate decarboxylase n=1 Tax=Protomyces lactucae-debilis TaxID=2754530 RepID=A0A1Y2FVS7_PROLT|nr:diphosphomevalonate decarboxylase [Protomyces lactucae-debilis]ORY87657.1 diphosphomevalonate decarboxylase [Protomyces lactucae-debilis]